MNNKYSKLKKLNIKDLIKKVKNGEVISNVYIHEKITVKTLEDLIYYDSIKQEYSMKYPFIIQNCDIDYIDLNSVHFNNKFELRYCNIGSVIFDHSYFLKVANFNSSVFESYVSFYQCNFYYYTYFSNAVFKCNTKFDFCYFGEHLLFRNSYLKLNSSFHSCTFKKKVLFTHMIFNKLDFKSSRFYDYINISNVENFMLKKESEFYRNEAVVLFTNTHFYDLVDLNKLECNFIDFSNSISRDIIELAEAKFDLIGLDNFKFETLYVEMNQLIKKEKLLKKSTFCINHCDNVRIMKKILIALKNNYQKLGWHKEEDRIYREFKVIELIEKKESKNYLEYFLGRYILNLFFGFGTLPMRAFIASIMLQFAYGILYTVYGINSVHAGIVFDKYAFKDFFTYLYFSAVTYTTVGYGDLTPVGFSRFLAASEGFLGIFMMSAFTVTFARKLIR